MVSFEHRLPEQTGQDDLLELIGRLNRDPSVHGVLVQLPLPRHIDESAVLAAIDPAKGVDGFHIVNAGLLVTGGQGSVPCAPNGAMMLIQDTLGEISGPGPVDVRGIFRIPNGLQIRFKV
jgi:methylenetetrahydrofolate dehydrogenase (NADP+)/methenyltetrahydrofolate cyclohydrolase